MTWRFVLLAILLLSCVRIAVPFAGQGVWWDEAVYLGLAQGIRAGHYSLDSMQTVESFRPPLIPAVLSILPSTQIASVVFVLLSLTSIVSVFLLGRTFNTRVGLIAALFTATLPLFVVQGSKLMTEPLFMTFTCLSLLFWERLSPRSLALSGAFLGFAFLTRYVALILLAGYVILFAMSVIKKEQRLREAIFFVVPFLLVIAPWAALSWHSYGSPWAAALVNAHVYSVSIQQSFGDGLWLLVSALTFLLPFVALSFWRKKFPDALPLLCVLILALFLSGPHKEDRYLLSFLPIFAILAAEGGEILMLQFPRVQKPLIGVFVVLSLVSFAWGMNAAVQDVQYDAVVRAMHYLAERDPTTQVLTQSYPFAYAAGLHAQPYCPWPQDTFDACQGQILASGSAVQELQHAIVRVQSTYVVSYAYEPANPADARVYLDEHFQKIQTFEQWGNPEAVVIYRL